MKEQGISKNIQNFEYFSNTASSGSFSSLPVNTNPSGYFGLGRGGMGFREGAANNTVQLSGVRLEGNTAQFGGASNCTITVLHECSRSLY